VTGFEFFLTPLPINNIKHLTRQKSENPGRIYANLQPAATGKSKACGIQGSRAGRGSIAGAHHDQVLRSSPVKQKRVVPVRDRRTREGVMKFFSRQKRNATLSQLA